MRAAITTKAKTTASSSRHLSEETGSQMPLWVVTECRLSGLWRRNNVSTSCQAPHAPKQRQHVLLVYGAVTKSPDVCVLKVEAHRAFFWPPDQNTCISLSTVISMTLSQIVTRSCKVEKPVKETIVLARSGPLHLLDQPWRTCTPTDLPMVPIAPKQTMSRRTAPWTRQSMQQTAVPSDVLSTELVSSPDTFDW